MADEQNEYERCADICDKVASNLRSHSEKSDVNLDVLAGGIIVASTLAERLRLEKTAKPAAETAESALRDAREKYLIVWNCLTGVNPFDAGGYCPWCRRDEPAQSEETIVTTDPEWHNKACELMAAIKIVRALLTAGRSDTGGKVA